MEHLPGLEEALSQFRDQDPIALGDIHADISQSQNPCSQHVTELLMESVMLSLLHQFWQTLRFCHLNTWY